MSDRLHQVMPGYIRLRQVTPVYVGGTGRGARQYFHLQYVTNVHSHPHHDNLKHIFAVIPIKFTLTVSYHSIFCTCKLFQSNFQQNMY